MKPFAASKDNNYNQITISDLDQFRKNFQPVRPVGSYNDMESLQQILHTDSFAYQPVETNPDVSFMHVIIPVYNNRKYLTDLLASLSRQDTTTPVHYVFVDDGSSDFSVVKLLELIANFTYTNFRSPAKTYFTILHSNHQGVSQARNLGLNAVLSFCFAQRVEQDLFASTNNLYVADNSVEQYLTTQCQTDPACTQTAASLFAQIQRNPALNGVQIGCQDFIVKQPCINKLTDFSYLASQWLTFIDSDDFVSDNYFLGLEEHIQADSRKNLVVLSDVLDYNHLSKETSERFAGRIMLQPNETVVPLLNLKTYSRVVCFTAFRLDLIALDQICFDNGIDLGEDFIFNWLYTLAALKYISQPTVSQNLNAVYYYRQGHNNTLSSKLDFSFNYVDSKTLAEKSELELARANGKIIDSFPKALGRFINHDLSNVIYFTNFIMYVEQQAKVELAPIYLVYQIFSIVGRSFNNIFFNLEKGDYFEYDVSSDKLTVSDNLVPVLPYLGYLHIQSHYLSRYGVAGFFSFLGEDSIPLRVLIACNNYHGLGQRRSLYKAYTAIQQFKEDEAYYTRHKFNLMHLPFKIRLTTIDIDQKFNHIYNLYINSPNQLLVENFRYCFELTSFANVNFFKDNSISFFTTKQTLPFAYQFEIDQALAVFYHKQEQLNSFLRKYQHNLLKDTNLEQFIAQDQALAQTLGVTTNVVTNHQVKASQPKLDQTHPQAQAQPQVKTQQLNSVKPAQSSASWCEQFLAQAQNQAQDQVSATKQLASGNSSQQEATPASRSKSPYATYPATVGTPVSIYQSNAYNKAAVLASYNLDPQVAQLVYNPPKFISRITPQELEVLTAEGLYHAGQSFELDFNCYDQQNSFNPVGVCEIIPDEHTTPESLRLAISNYLENFTQLFLCYRTDLISAELQQVISEYNQTSSAVKSMAISPEFLENYLNYIPDDRSDFTNRLVGKVSDRCKFLNIVLTQLNNFTNTHLSLALFFNNHCYFNRKEFVSGLVRSLKYRNCFGFNLLTTDLSIDPQTQQVYLDQITNTSDDNQIFMFRIRTNWFFDVDNYTEQTVKEFNHLPFHQQLVKICVRNNEGYLHACPPAGKGFAGVYRLADVTQPVTYTPQLLAQTQVDSAQLQHLSRLNNFNHYFMEVTTPQSLHFYDEEVFADKSAVKEFCRAWVQARKS